MIGTTSPTACCRVAVAWEPTGDPACQACEMRSTTTSSRTRRSTETGGATSGTHARGPGQPARAGFSAPSGADRRHAPFPKAGPRVERTTSAATRQAAVTNAPAVPARATRRLRGKARAGLGTSTARPRTQRQRRRRPPVAKPRRTNPTVRSTPSGRPVRVNTPRTGAVRNRRRDTEERKPIRRRVRAAPPFTRARATPCRSGTDTAANRSMTCGRAQRHAPGHRGASVTLASRHGQPGPRGRRAPVLSPGAARYEPCRRSCCGTLRHEALRRAHASASRRREAPPPRERGDLGTAVHAQRYRISRPPARGTRVAAPRSARRGATSTRPPTRRRPAARAADPSSYGASAMSPAEAPRAAAAADRRPAPAIRDAPPCEAATHATRAAPRRADRACATASP